MARVAVVTGGTRGIGAAISKALKAAGYKVAATYAGNDEAAQKFKAETGINVYKWDVSSFDACAAGIKQVEADLGPVEVLVNNAGIARRDQAAQERMLGQLEAALTGGERRSLGATSSLSDEDWDRMIRVHLYGAFHCTREALKVMEQRGRGAIVNMSSVAALQGLPGSPDYSAAKGALIGFTKSVAREVIGSGIRVNAIAPGWIRTPMVTEEIDPRLLPILLAQVPAGGMGEPEHIAALALHLCSDEASYTTGQVVSPNGGLYT
jgi:acetoacetyl-CoA reductase